MNTALDSLLRDVVNNLHLTWLHRVIEKWAQKSPLEIRDDLGIASYSETITEPQDMYKRVKKHILSEAFQNPETLSFLLDVEAWAGFSFNTDEMDTTERVITAAHNGSIATLWLMAIPRAVVSPAVVPEETRSSGLTDLMQLVLESQESRTQLEEMMSMVLESKGIPREMFRLQAVVEGLRIGDSFRRSRTRLVVALIMLRSTDIPFDLDRVFSMETPELLKEITAYIAAMHTMSTLRREITGMGGRSTFEWPAVGDTGSCMKLFSHLQVLQDAVSDMSACTSFQKTVQGTRRPWTDREFISYLVDELTDHYSSTLKKLKNRGVNRELAAFVEYMKTENYDMVSDLMESKNRAETLFEELKYYRRSARTGEKPDVRPERKFRITLADIKNNIQERGSQKTNLPELVELVTEAFDAIAEMVVENIDVLGSDAEKFAETLCFETCQGVLGLLSLEGTIGDLLWVSRFISEESVRARPLVQNGGSADLGDKVRRISSAFASGVVYMIAQADN